jgi:RNA polymerase sigma factor (sigma-70 family)
VEEVLDDALMRLVEPRRRRECAAAGGALVPWLARWAFWAMSTRARAERRARQARAAAAQLAASHPVLPGDDSDPPAEDLRMRALREAFALLTPVDQDVLLWVYGEGLEAAEIGRRLGITEGAARKRAFDARARLRRHLKNMGWDPDAAGGERDGP